MKAKIIILISTIALIISLSFFAYALLTVEKATPELEYKVGELKINVGGEFVDELDDGLLVPGVNLIKNPFVITNAGTINVHLRIKLTITLDNAVFNDFEANGFDFNSDETFTLLDGFYYLNNEFTPTEVINLISVMILDGFKVQSGNSHEKFKVSLEIHAKQTNHVEWEDLGVKFIN